MKKIKPQIILLSLFSICLFIFSVVWISRDSNGIFLSDAAHLFNARCHYNSLLKLDIQSFMLVRELYPNLFHQMAAILTLVTHDIYVSAAALNSFFVIMIMWGAYCLGSFLWDENTGFLAAVTVPAFIGVTRFLFVNNIDVALAVFVVWAFYFLIKSNDFKDKKNSLLFLLVFLAGMLIKWAMLFYLLIPLVWVLIRVFMECGRSDESGKNISRPIFVFSLILITAIYAILAYFTGISGKDELGYPPVDRFWVLLIGVYIAGIVSFSLIQWISRRRSDPAVSFISGFILSLALTAHYYLYAFYFLVNTYLGRFWGGQELQKHASQHNPWYFLVKSFILDFTGIIVFVMLIIGLFFYLADKNKPRGTGLIIAGFISSMVILALQPIYDTRYFLPLAGILSVFCVLPLRAVKQKVLHGIAVLLICFFSIISFAGKVYPKVGIPMVTGVYTDEKTEKISAMKAAISEISGEPGNSIKKPMLVVFYDSNISVRLKPLVIMYFLSEITKPEDRIYLFPEGLDLRRGVEGVPLMYYIAAESDNDDNAGTDIDSTDSDLDTDKEDSDAGVSGDMTWESLKPESVCLILFGEDNPSDLLPPAAERSLKRQWLDGYKSRNDFAEIRNPQQGYRILIWKND